MGVILNHRDVEIRMYNFFGKLLKIFFLFFNYFPTKYIRISTSLSYKIAPICHIFLWHTAGILHTSSATPKKTASKPKFQRRLTKKKENIGMNMNDKNNNKKRKLHFFSFWKIVQNTQEIQKNGQEWLYIDIYIYFDLGRIYENGKTCFFFLILPRPGNRYGAGCSSKI